MRLSWLPIVVLATATPAWSSDHSLLLSHLNDAKRTAESLLSLIYNRFEMNTTMGSDFFHVSHNVGKDTWEGLKYKFGKKIVEAHMFVGGVEKSPFVYVFGGSSVTAGHDNYYNQSYPKVFERRMRPVFDALRVGLAVRNIAVGSLGCEPYNSCYEAFGGSDPDFVTWEQSYFCKSSANTEALARYAASSSNHAIMAFLASGSPPMSACTKKSPDTVPYSDERWTPAAAGLPEWSPSLVDIQAEMQRMDIFHRAAPTGQGFYRYLTPYKSVIKQYGMEFWVKNPKASSLAMGTGDSIMSSCRLKFATVEATRHGTGHGTASHPTVGKHLMRAELIAWIHGMILLDAIYMVKNDLERHSSVSKLSDEYSRVINEMFSNALPSPVLCAKGGMHCPYKVQCYSDFEPHFNSRLYLKDLLVGPLRWERHARGENAERWKKYGYNDTKWRFSSKDDKDMLHIKVSVGALGVVQFCFQDGSEIPNSFVDLSVAEAGPHYSPPKGLEKWTSVRETMSCGRGRHGKQLGVELFNLPVGNHVVSLINRGVTVSHVMMWPA